MGWYEDWVDADGQEREAANTPPPHRWMHWSHLVFLIEVVSLKVGELVCKVVGHKPYCYSSINQEWGVETVVCDRCGEVLVDHIYY